MRPVRDHPEGNTERKEPCRTKPRQQGGNPHTPLVFGIEGYGCLNNPNHQPEQKTDSQRPGAICHQIKSLYRTLALATNHGSK